VPFNTHVTEADFYWIPNAVDAATASRPRALLQDALTALEKRQLGKE